MREELVKFVLENDLSPFSNSKTTIRQNEESIFKTKDAKAIHTKVLSQISSNFFFSETSNIWNLFRFTENFNEIKKRQEFFASILSQDLSLFKKLSKPIPKWKPKYDVIAVTEDESTFVKLNELGCSTSLLFSEDDCMELERYDIIQVVDVDNFQRLLERLPQTVFMNSLEDIYLERFLEKLSGWKENFSFLKSIQDKLSPKIQEILRELEEMFYLLENKDGKIITQTEVERVLQNINEKVSVKIREMTITGEGLLKILGEGKMPKDFLDIVRDSIQESGFSEQIFNLQIPVTIDQKELEDQIKRQSATEFTSIAERVKKNSVKIKAIPSKLRELEARLIVEDFCVGVANWIGILGNYPREYDKLELIDSSNIFLKNPSPISFQLSELTRCSILTGANSGGKTTLLEHIIQNIGLFQLGLPTRGNFQSPLFTEVYYFAKNKGSASKGAFETLLTQMSEITPGRKTLILADEIEAVTEPGIAGKIISATADYFIQKKCFLVIATHLGYEIQKTLPKGARIDGIEAKGLDENFNLIVDHNPVLGRLAHSTPELIVERMANTNKGDYFRFLWGSMKG